MQSQFKDKFRIRVTQAPVEIDAQRSAAVDGIVTKLRASSVKPSKPCSEHPRIQNLVNGLRERVSFYRRKF